MNNITVISDTHGSHRQLFLSGGNILIHCGDFSCLGEEKEIEDFLNWFSNQEYTWKIFIAGNHDLSFQRDLQLKRKLLSKYKSLIYLENGMATILGLNIWGSPWQPEYGDWAFGLPRKGEELELNWLKMPSNTDILITHTAPYEILDPNYGGYPVGCELLLERVKEVQPIAHFFGHLHEGHGWKTTQNIRTVFGNASFVDNWNDPKYQELNLKISSSKIISIV
jgi:Icc-related predicted phosphoesterase